MVSGLREDALSSVPDGFELRVGLPWIRSLPLAGVIQLRVVVDERPLAESEIRVVLGRRRITPDQLTDEVDRWWFLQDRLVIAGGAVLAPGHHEVAVDLRVLVPYLSAGPGVPLVLPFHLEADLELDHPVSPSVARDVGKEGSGYD
jgi:hypothetical protein